MLTSSPTRSLRRRRSITPSQPILLPPDATPNFCPTTRNIYNAAPWMPLKSDTVVVSSERVGTLEQKHPAKDATIRCGVRTAGFYPSKSQLTLESISAIQIQKRTSFTASKFLASTPRQLVDSVKLVVACHVRSRSCSAACKSKEVPVIRLDHLTGGQAKAYMLADNKLTDRSSWDDRKLAIVLKELSDIALDFEIEATGFEPPEIDLRIQSLDPPEEAGDSADEFEIAEGAPVSRPGDLWTLGDHRLLCGNALKPQSYHVLLEGEKAAAVFTDPPYNVRVNGHVSGKGAKKHHEFRWPLEK